MPTVTGVGGAGSVPEPASGGHGAHEVPSGGESSFASALSRAVSRSSPVTPQAASPVAPGTGNAAMTSGTGFQRRHIPLLGAGLPDHDFQQVAMGLRTYRQQVIASNIANADTPGYKAVDIDFREALRIVQAMSNQPPVPLVTTAKSHLPGQITTPQAAIPLKYHVPSQGSVDGNTVEMDIERAKFAENTIRLQFAMDRVSGHFKHEIEMIQNLK